VRKTIVVICTIALGAFVLAGIASAAPGPNGHNDFGLCKAYLHGSDNKQDKGPFPALATKAGDQDGDGDTDSSDVEQYCGGVFPGGKDSSPGNSGVTGAANPSH
jgi:hypothetical protein